MSRSDIQVLLIKYKEKLNEAYHFIKDFEPIMLTSSEKEDFNYIRFESEMNLELVEELIKKLEK